MTWNVGTACCIRLCHKPRCIEAGQYRFCSEHWRAELARREIDRLAKLALRPHHKRIGRKPRELHQVVTNETNARSVASSPTNP